MFLVPFSLIEQFIRLVVLILEGTPIEIRRAQAAQWFWTWWPIAKLLVKEEYRGVIEGIAKGEEGPK